MEDLALQFSGNGFWRPGNRRQTPGTIPATVPQPGCQSYGNDDGAVSRRRSGFFYQDRGELRDSSVDGTDYMEVADRRRISSALTPLLSRLAGFRVCIGKVRELFLDR